MVGHTYFGIVVGEAVWRSLLFKELVVTLIFKKPKGLEYSKEQKFKAEIKLKFVYPATELVQLQIRDLPSTIKHKFN